jgi:hypothetical protein
VETNWRLLLLVDVSNKSSGIPHHWGQKQVGNHRLHLMEAIDTALFGTVHHKQSINQKRKGNRNEALVAKILSDWTKHEFCRVPMSGGLRWKNRMDICGDVINTDPEFKFIFSVETKAVKGFSFHKNSKIHTYFDQAQRDADASGKLPFLIVRHNYLKEGSYYIFLRLNFEQFLKINNYIAPQVVMEDLYGFLSITFFKTVSYEILKWIYNG